jgi:hypothetical protein
MNVYLEIGKKKTFAIALDWPGWSRSGPDEASSLQALCDYGPRYQRAIEKSGLGFTPVEDISAFTIVQRLRGNAGTDFGAPNVHPDSDSAPLNPAELQRFEALLQAMWHSFDEAVKHLQGKPLRTGPHGGGQDLEKIVDHVLEAEIAYLGKLGGSFRRDEPLETSQVFQPLRQAILSALGASAHGELPKVGLRGGKRWTARFYVRYAAWHLLDHLWEMEDRAE